ncbi:KaiC domain-containing protein [Halobium salinum]|uniref:KaiC domain-containing protein n=1 Tax=Halobium salinum TaxID=1364940 RepID=A0ABD5P982_9EURY|nr:KaiC domain-containing protein [Halobium salinum]
MSEGEDGDDWFERAIREPAVEEGSDAGEQRVESGDSGVESGDEAPATGEVDAEQTDAADGSTFGFDAESSGFDAESGVDPNPDPGPSGASGHDTGDSSADPFGEDFATAFQNAPSLGGPSGADADAGFDDTGPADAGFGMGSPQGHAGGAPGFGEFGQQSGSGFDATDEEEFESTIPRIALGIDGLDEMVLGGVPERSLIAVIGSAGTGKTTFGLQFLHEALREGDSAVYITLEESREAVLSTAEEKGWPFRSYAEEDRLAVVAMDPVEMANSLESIRNDLPRLVEAFGADRVVLDSVSLLEMMYDHPSKRRSEVFEFARSLKRIGVTTMLTSEASEDTPYASRFGIVEYLTDAVFVLQYVRPSNFRETRLAVEIQKIRDANHSRETKPYDITDDGISVHRQANIF